VKDEPKDNPIVSLIDDDDDDPIGRSMAEAWHNHPYIMGVDAVTGEAPIETDGDAVPPITELDIRMIAHALHDQGRGHVLADMIVGVTGERPPDDAFSPRKLPIRDPEWRKVRRKAERQKHQAGRRARMTDEEKAKQIGNLQLWKANNPDKMQAAESRRLQRKKADRKSKTSSLSKPFLGDGRIFIEDICVASLDWNRPGSGSWRHRSRRTRRGRRGTRRGNHRGRRTRRGNHRNLAAQPSRRGGTSLSGSRVRCVKSIGHGSLRRGTWRALHLHRQATGLDRETNLAATVQRLEGAADMARIIVRSGHFHNIGYGQSIAVLKHFLDV
jgi:hypothetical protein